jgi:hypothetical protein
MREEPIAGTAMALAHVLPFGVMFMDGTMLQESATILSEGSYCGAAASPCPALLHEIAMRDIALRYIGRFAGCARSATLLH